MNYLQQFDSRVSSHNSAEGGTYVGTILKTTDGILYFVPLSSYKPNKEARMRNRQQITIYLHEDGNNNNKLGYLLLNNPWIAQCILNFINENDSIKIDLEYVSPNEVDMTLSNVREFSSNNSNLSCMRMSDETWIR